MPTIGSTSRNSWSCRSARRAFAEALRCGAEIFHALKGALHDKGLSTAVGDEGGFAPNIGSARAALDLIGEAVGDAGYKLGGDVLLALDCAATEFFRDGDYAWWARGESVAARRMADFLAELGPDYPIASIEDGMGEDDMAGWKALTDKIGERVPAGRRRSVRDQRQSGWARGIADGIANSILIKVNQIGTLTETIDAVRMAQTNGYTAVMTHRSGETEDSTIADLAVALGCGQIKTGSLARSDRTAKYNQLLRIEEELGDGARYPGRAALKAYHR